MDTYSKKRLGQYFSGSKVADLLVDLCALTTNDLVIDPMAGTGDMLEASSKMGVPTANLYGIEIDPRAGHICKERISPGKVFIGDAFSLEPYAFFTDRSWDLVITNPPYVRYQTMSKYDSGGIVLQNAAEVRRNLNNIINILDHLSFEEKACFQKIIKNYSGLSDLAVPAWVLCAALTKQNGQLAMVVPESWISRDYALSIKYMLLKFFDIRYIVEDLNSKWFPDALVKTNLLVARRVEFRSNLLEFEDTTYKFVRLSSLLSGEKSLVDKLTYSGQTGRNAFINLVNYEKDICIDGLEVKHKRMSDFMSEMVASPVSSRLLSKLEPKSNSMSDTTIPIELRDLLGEEWAPCKLVDITGWGFHVGQGLRTGANQFFYTELVKTDGDIDYLAASRIFGDKIIPVPRQYSFPAFRYQSDSGDSYVIAKKMLSHRLLYIGEAFFISDGILQNTADASLYEHINFAENMTIDSGGKTTRFPELTAVKPNIRAAGSEGNSLKRYWFMLPTLAKRHTPRLCIARVIYKNAKCYMIAEDGIVVDANFSTLWTDTTDERKDYAMFALMNSSWIQAYLESIATIMGGGALKVEASHIRRLLLPLPTDTLVSSLYQHGQSLAEGNPIERVKILIEIDKLILHAICGFNDVEKQYHDLRTFLQLKTEGRQR